MILFYMWCFSMEFIPPNTIKTNSDDLITTPHQVWSIDQQWSWLTQTQQSWAVPDFAFHNTNDATVTADPTWWKIQSESIVSTKNKPLGSFQKIVPTWLSTFWLHKIWAIGGIVVMMSIGLLFLYVTQIQLWNDARDSNKQESIDSYKSTIMSIDGVIWYPWVTQQAQLLTVLNKENFNTVIGSIIPFIFKRDIIETAVQQLVWEIIVKNQELQASSQEITKFGFIHPNVMSLLEDNKNQIPIMVSLHTLETIKFGTAMKIFGMLDTFLQQWSQKLQINKDNLFTAIEDLSKRWERDIANYLAMCYLNPYENFPNCNNVNDFENYFLYEDTENPIDTVLFGKLFSLIDERLENSLVSSLQIDFNRFNPNAKNIAFRVTVNTLQEDDIGFMARWILNPHVFITSTLVSLLRQSLFVVWDSISIDRLNIRQQNITVWNIQVPVQTSTLSFDLPLQDPAQREIFDFYDIY